jgi:hypothetical protein
VKKTIIGGLLPGGVMLGAAGLVVGAGLANADSYGYKGDHDANAYELELMADGAIPTNGSVADLAQKVCKERAAGYSEKELMDRLENPSATHYGTKWSVDTVMGAEFHFCPEYR